MAKPHMVERILSLQLANRTERMKGERRELIRSIQRHSGDVGSPEVVACTLTHKIREQAEVFQDNRKNFLKVTCHVTPT